MGPKRGRTGGGPGTNQYEVKGASGAQPAAGRVDAFAAGPGLATCAGCPRRVPAGELVDELCPECTLDGREYDAERDPESYRAEAPATNEPVPARGENARWDRAFGQAREHGATNDEATAFAQLVHGRALDESDEADVCGRFVELCRGGTPLDAAGRLVTPLIEELAGDHEDEPASDDDYWSCPGCGASVEPSDVRRHAAECDLVDGAGNPVDAATSCEVCDTPTPSGDIQNGQCDSCRAAAQDEILADDRFDDPGEEWWRQLEPGDEIRVGPNEDSWRLVEPPTIGPGGRLVVKACRPTGGDVEAFGVDEIA